MRTDALREKWRIEPSTQEQLRQNVLAVLTDIFERGEEVPVVVSWDAVGAGQTGVEQGGCGGCAVVWDIQLHWGVFCAYVVATCCIPVSGQPVEMGTYAP